MGPHLGLARLRLALVALGPPLALAKDLGGGWKEKTNAEGKVVQELKIEAPAFTEEDQYGYVMPDRYRCDSCRAVMFHLDQGLRKKHPKSRRMKQWEFTDAFDDTCRSGFEGYGIRLINGENTLSGPGLKDNAEQLAPGSGAIQMGGESWSKRLGEICRKIVFEKVGEDEVYELFYKRFRAEMAAKGEAEGDTLEPGLSESLCTTELRECVAGPKPPPPPKQKEAAAEKAPKPEKAKPKAGKASKGKAEKAKAKAKAEAAPPKPASPAERPAQGSGGVDRSEVVDVQTFLRGLAVRHGLTSDEYLAARSVGEWEKLTLAIASRLFNQLAASEPGDSCRA